MSHGSANSRGVAILFKKGVDCIIHSKILDPVGCFVILKAEIKDKMYLLINIYAPNKDTNIVEFLKDLGTTLQKENLDGEKILSLEETLIVLLIRCSIRKEVYFYRENQS